MNLSDYLKSTGEYDRAYKFARRAGVSIPVIYALLDMEKGGNKFYRRILLDTALKIRNASAGLISLERLGVADPQADPPPTRLPAAVP